MKVHATALSLDGSGNMGSTEPPAKADVADLEAGAGGSRTEPSADKLRTIFMARGMDITGDKEKDDKTFGYLESTNGLDLGYLRATDLNPQRDGKQLGWYFLNKLGGPQPVGKDLGTEFDSRGKPLGLKKSKIEANATKYGRNALPRTECKTLLEHCKEALADPTLIVLLVVAAIQIVICVVEIGLSEDFACKSVEMQDCEQHQEELHRLAEFSKTKNGPFDRIKNNLTDIQRFSDQSLMRTEFLHVLADCYTNDTHCYTNDTHAEKACCTAAKELNAPNIRNIKVGYSVSFGNVLDAIRDCPKELVPGKCEGDLIMYGFEGQNVCSNKAACVSAAIARINVRHLTTKLPEDESTLWIRSMLAHFNTTTRVGAIEECRVWNEVSDCDQDGTCLKVSHGNKYVCLIDGFAIIITVMVVTLVGAVQNFRSDQKFAEMNDDDQKEPIEVVREGKSEIIDKSEIVVGDIVIVKTGNMIPCDGFCLESNNCGVDQSAMTGEPDLINKRNFPQAKKEADTWMIAGCPVKQGDATFLCTAVGTNTEYGKMMESMATPNEDTPLQKKLIKMANDIGYCGMAAATATFISLVLLMVVGDIAINKEHCPDFMSVFGTICSHLIIAVTIVVVAVPEGLPLAVTIALSYSMDKMYDEKIFVRQLKACETMGGATNICTDKTGTLTQNKMAVVEGWFAGLSITKGAAQSAAGEVSNEKRVARDVTTDLGKAFAEKVMQGISFNSDARLAPSTGDDPDRYEFEGNVTECAMLTMVHQMGQHLKHEGTGFHYEQYRSQMADGRLTRKEPFSSQKKRMTCVIGGEVPTLWSKGAAEIMLEDCIRFTNADLSVADMDDSKRAEIANKIEAMAKNGLRCILVAYRDTDLPADWSTRDAEGDFVVSADVLTDKTLTCLCVVGIQDPPRPEVPGAVKKCQSAGITVRMVTGDNLNTACKIAQEVNIIKEGETLEPRHYIEGPEFRTLSTSEMTARLRGGLVVMARSSPLDKEILVKRLRAMGEIVGVTGDGTNDAPALKSANIGLSMGLTGTKVAKAASHVVIMDDNFASIVQACKWGRNVYDSVRKFLQFQLTVNIVAVLLVFIAAVTKHEPPLTAVQLLWVNMIMDSLGALALATEYPTEKILERNPNRPDEPLVSRPMWRNVLLQAAYQLAICLLFLYAGREFLPVSLSQIADADDRDLETTKVCAYFLNEHPKKFNQECIDNIDASKYGSLRDIFQSRKDDPKFEERSLKIADMIPHEQGTTVLNTMIFNSFVLMQVFNQINARRINDMNVLDRVHQHPLFVIIMLIEAVLQVLLVQVPGLNTAFKCTALTTAQWGWCVMIGAISLVIGLVMHSPLMQFGMCQADGGADEDDGEKSRIAVQKILKTNGIDYEGLQLDNLVNELQEWKDAEDDDEEDGDNEGDTKPQFNSDTAAQVAAGK